jgi:hypothetical protein
MLMARSRWCEENAPFIQSPPHPSPLPYYLHRFVFLSLQPPSAALLYAREYLLPYATSQPVLQLVTSCLYPTKVTSNTTANDINMDIDTPPPLASPYHHDPAPLVSMFRAEYCRRHGIAKEEPLDVAVELGSRGGALGAIEKARKVMGDRLGSVRTWTDLPVHLSLLLSASTDRIRWKSHYLQTDVTIQSSYVLYRKNRRRRSIRPKC